MSAVAWLSLHSLTRASIEMQPHTVNDWNCGCWRSPLSHERVNLCEYHQGYDDGIATLEELNDTYTIRRRAHNAEAALADQLAEALRDETRNGPLRAGGVAALAAYARARTPTTQEPM